MRVRILLFSTGLVLMMGCDPGPLPPVPQSHPAHAGAATLPLPEGSGVLARQPATRPPTMQQPPDQMKGHDHGGHH